MKTLFLAGLLLSLNSVAMANDWARETIDFALEFSQQKIAVNSDSNSAELRINGYTLRMRESYGDRFQAGLVLGGMDARMRKMPGIEHVDTFGYHLGIGLDFNLARTQSLSLDSRLQLRYSDSNGSANDQDIELSWLLSEAQIRLSWQPTMLTTLYVCGHGGHLSGEHIGTGQNNFDHDLSLRQHGGYCAGITRNLDQSGYIGINFNHDYSDGITVYFGRRFD